MMIRRPAPADWGLDVTIAIVALTAPFDFFVCVSDRMVSHDDILTGNDNALIKNLGLCEEWSVAYAADDVRCILPILEDVKGKMSEKGSWSADDIKRYFKEVYAERKQSDFLDKRLRRYNYSSIEKFRQEGRRELDNHFFDLAGS
jgi:hypothetical protein